MASEAKYAADAKAAEAARLASIRANPPTIRNLQGFDFARMGMPANTSLEDLKNKYGFDWKYIPGVSHSNDVADTQGRWSFSNAKGQEALLNDPADFISHFGDALGTGTRLFATTALNSATGGAAGGFINASQKKGHDFGDLLEGAAKGYAKGYLTNYAAGNDPYGYGTSTAGRMGSAATTAGLMSAAQGDNLNTQFQKAGAAGATSGLGSMITPQTGSDSANAAIRAAAMNAARQGLLSGKIDASSVLNAGLASGIGSGLSSYFGKPYQGLLTNITGSLLNRPQQPNQGMLTQGSQMATNPAFSGYNPQQLQQKYAQYLAQKRG